MRLRDLLPRRDQAADRRDDICSHRQPAEDAEPFDCRGCLIEEVLDGIVRREAPQPAR